MRNKWWKNYKQSAYAKAHVNSIPTWQPNLTKAHVNSIPTWQPNLTKAHVNSIPTWQPNLTKAHVNSISTRQPNLTKAHLNSIPTWQPNLLISYNSNSLSMIRILGSTNFIQNKRALKNLEHLFSQDTWLNINQP